MSKSAKVRKNIEFTSCILNIPLYVFVCVCLLYVCVCAWACVCGCTRVSTCRCVHVCMHAYRVMLHAYRVMYVFACLREWLSVCVCGVGNVCAHCCVHVRVFCIYVCVCFVCVFVLTWMSTVLILFTQYTLFIQIT